MALKATIFKAKLQLADIDRGYYGEHLLTLARHPSETDERLMVRLLAFAINADPQLQFTRGLSTEDQADLWQRDDSGEIRRWIEVGLPAWERLRRGCSRAGEMLVYAYGARPAPVWWRKQQANARRLDNLRVYYLTGASTAALAALAQRNMEFSITIQDGQIWLASAAASVEIALQVWQ